MRVGMESHLVCSDTIWIWEWSDGEYAFLQINLHIKIIFRKTCDWIKFCVVQIWWLNFWVEIQSQTIENISALLSDYQPYSEVRFSDVGNCTMLLESRISPVYEHRPCLRPVHANGCLGDWRFRFVSSCGPADIFWRVRSLLATKFPTCNLGGWPVGCKCRGGMVMSNISEVDTGSVNYGLKFEVESLALDLRKCWRLTKSWFR